ncbi:CS1 type fimbrial major subunit, partial [Aeromonas veronii]|uniref:CS1 type fimbrial major subunit n=1 Tax=Aeromonas veronii TaxID=654 RepID=UPI002B49F674
PPLSYAPWALHLLSEFTVGLEIIPAAAPTGGYKPGNYQGIVSMMFESEAPPAPPAQGS